MPARSGQFFDDCVDQPEPRTMCRKTASAKIETRRCNQGQLRDPSDDKSTVKMLLVAANFRYSRTTIRQKIAEH
jgi:hypothetical protein